MSQKKEKPTCEGANAQPVRKSNRTNQGKVPSHLNDYLLNSTPFIEQPRAQPRGLSVMDSALNFSAISDEETVVYNEKNDRSNTTFMMKELMKTMADMKVDVMHSIHENNLQMQNQMNQVQNELQKTNAKISHLEAGTASNESNYQFPTQKSRNQHVGTEHTLPLTSSQPTIGQATMAPVVTSKCMMPSMFSQPSITQCNSRLGNNAATPQVASIQQERCNPVVNLDQSRFGDRRKLHDLPLFNGAPEEWPMFVTSFRQSTDAFGYTNLENQIRLQKCLSGPARQVVEAMLIYSENVPEIVNELEFRFGRPEQLVKSQMAKIHEVSPICEDDLLSLIDFSTKVRNLVAFLHSARCEQYLLNPTLVEELVTKLSIQKRLSWAEHLMTIRGIPSVSDFAEWLSRIARLASLVEQISTPTKTSNVRKNSTQIKKFTLQATEVQDFRLKKCKYCQQDHKIYVCPDFDKLQVAQRWKWVKQENVCFSCLQYGHRINECRNSKKCDIDNCNRKHHPLLHENFENVETQSLSAQVLSLHQTNEQVYFRIVPVTLYGNNNKVIKTFAMFDEGSSTSMMDANLANELDLNGKPDQITMQWFDQHTVTKSSTIVNFKIQGHDPASQMLLMKNVQAVSDFNLPCQTISRTNLVNMYPQLQELPIKEYMNARPRLLIGLDNARLGYATEWIDCPPFGPTAVKTSLGWLVYGPKNDPDTLCKKRLLFVNQSAAQDKLNEEYEKLNDLVHDFYEMENFGVDKPIDGIKTKEEVRATQMLTENTKLVESHYETCLLWKSCDVVMPNSYQMAVKRLENLEKKMRGDHGYAELYKKHMNEFVEKNYARKLTDEESEITTKRTWYLPHFGVVNPNKPGKLRIVFDAASVVNGVSLNSQLLKGPDLNKSLMNVLSHFREKRIAVCGDIREMFLQVKMIPEDRASQRFLWRDGESKKPIVIYEMMSMIFGATCAPTIAQFVKNVNAEGFKVQYPEAVDCIVNHHYVDDFVMSFENENTAIRISQEVKKIQAAANFELRNFVSNAKNVQQQLNDDATSQLVIKDMNVDSLKANEKILGMHWDNGTDEFVFEFKMYKVPSEVLNQSRPPTKREMISVIMSVFDPNGFIANFHMYAKILLQTTWNHNLDWDELVTESIVKIWYQWLSELENVKQLRIPRCYSRNLSKTENVQLHIFVDASEEGYSAVSYWRIADEDIELVFVYGKTRVAPRKQLSMPRLELQAAVLGSRMCKAIYENHSIVPSKCYFWSDSKTVLHWIKSTDRRYKPFVAHRKSEILNTTNANDWKWVPTKLNVADDATRLKLPIKFDVDSRWLKGAEFLRESEEKWPTQPMDLCNYEISAEVRNERFNLLIITKTKPLVPEFVRFSSYHKLVRTVAWSYRAIYNFSSKMNQSPIFKGELTALEMNEAESIICRKIQIEEFAKEYDLLQNGHEISAESYIYSLNPYMDEWGLLRINGRIDAASVVPFSTRRPIILPKKGYVTELIINQYHRDLLHQNDETVISRIREKFWIPHLRTILKTVKKNCQFCKIKNAKPQRPKLGPLPYDRLAAYVRPFTYTGIDYFGPVTVTIGRRHEKRWVALFTCLTIRAVHLEVATDLSTDALILCIRNFVNIRGVPKRFRSDNGTNFVGIHKELQNVPDFFDTDELQQKLSRFGIEWIFNCPSDPSAGGSWERLVQSVKRSLNVALQEKSPREDVLRSLLTEVANIVNSRPLTHVPVSPDDDCPLTPNHFLLGEVNSTQVPGEINARLLCSRKQWKIAQQLKNHFYHRWVSEYLPLLTRRSKYFKDVPQLKPGDLVMICDTDIPINRWERAKVLEVFPGKDGQTRTVVIQTSKGQLRRPAHKLAKLNVEVNPQGDSRGRECREQTY